MSSQGGKETTVESLKDNVIESLGKLRLERIRRWWEGSRPGQDQIDERQERCIERMQAHFANLEGRDLVAGIPKRYREWRLWDFKPEAADQALQFLAGDDATLYLHGDIGTGKTSLAAATLYAWRWSGGGCRLECPANCRAADGNVGLFLPAYEAAARLRNLDKCGAAMVEWGSAWMLVLDDIGANRATPHVQEQLLFLLQQRYDRMLKTIVTSNLDLDGMAVALGERAASRLSEGVLVELTGGDKRAAGKTNA